MQLYKRGAIWWARGTDTEGKRWAKSTKVRIEDDPSGRRARQVAKKLELRQLLQEEPTPTLTLGQALASLRDHKRRLNRAPATMEILKAKGDRLVEAFGHAADMNQFALSDAEAYVDLRRKDGVSDHTISKELGTLRAALRVQKKHGRYVGEVAAWWPDALQSVYTPKTRWLTVAEYKALSLAAYPPRREHLAAYVYLGVRYSELFTMRAEHLNHRERTVRGQGTKTKGAVRIVPVAPALWPVLEKRAAAGSGPLFEPWRRQNQRQSLHRWCKKAGIEPVSSNDLRRTFASWLCSAGVPELTCARLMGHNSSTMVRRVYAQLSTESLRSAIDRLPEIAIGSPNGRREEDE